MFCKNCGQSLEDGVLICPNCNTPVDGYATTNAAQPQTPPVNANPYNTQPQAPYGAAQPPYGYPPQQPYAQQPYGVPPISQEPASVGLRVLCWFIPIVGIVLYFVKKDEKPVYAKQCGKVALISIIVNAVLSFLMTFFTAMMGAAMYY